MPSPLMVSWHNQTLLLNPSCSLLPLLSTAPSTTTDLCLLRRSSGHWRAPIMVVSDLSFRTRRWIHVHCSSSSNPSQDANDNGGETSPQPKMNSGDDLRAKIAKLGLSAVLAYGLIDGVTYTTFFVLSFLGYEKSTGKNPAANLKALLGIVILMWTGNNVTRPFRVAGAAALAPLIDRGLKKIQKYFNFPSLVYAFALVVAMVAGSCLSIVGLLILSRWRK